MQASRKNEKESKDGMKDKIILYIFVIFLYHLLSYFAIHQSLVNFYIKHGYLGVHYVFTQIASSFVFLVLISFQHHFGVKYYKFWKNLCMNVARSYLSYFVASFFDGNPVTYTVFNALDGSFLENIRYSFVIGPFIHITWTLGIFMTVFLFLYSKYYLKIKKG